MNELEDYKKKIIIASDELIHEEKCTGEAEHCSTCGFLKEIGLLHKISWDD